MIRLGSCILSRLLSSASPPCTSARSSLHSFRLLSSAAAPVSPNPTPRFAVVEYLLAACGLTRPQALKASTRLSHVKSPSKPNAVLSFLRALGLSSAEIGTVVAKDPAILCASVERTLGPNAVELTALGLSHSDIGRIIPFAPNHFRCRSVVPKLRYFVHLFGSLDDLLRALKGNGYLMGASLERTVKPNVALLHECGLDACAIARLPFKRPRLLASSPERVRAMVTRAEGLGVPRGSGMFSDALGAVAFLSEHEIAAKMDFVKKAFKWSDAEMLITAPVAVSKYPTLLNKSEDMLQRRSEFLISQVGLEPEYIAHRPAMLAYSLEGRLRPRYYVLKYLRKNGLQKCDYWRALTLTGTVFVERYICRHKDAAPDLADDYAAACRGEVPGRFRFP